MDDTPFVKEIRKQPAALRNLAEYYSGKEGAALLSEITTEIATKQKIIFTGMGTSLYAPYIIEKELAGLSQSIEIPDAGEFLHFGLRGIKRDEILLAISQSGESAETGKVVGKLKGKVKVVSIVNDTSSFMGKNSDYVLPLHAGVEASISTKTYTNTLAVLLLLSTCLNRRDPDTDIKHFHNTASAMEDSLEEINNKAVKAVNFFGELDTLHFVARGSDLVTARQWALIIKEGAGVFSEALSAGLFRHGPIELAGKGHSVIFIISEDNMPELTLNLAEETKKFGSRILVVSDNRKYGNLPVMNVNIESPSSRCFPLMCAPFIELFVHEAAKHKGREAGIFRHATKITSKE